MGKNLKCFMLYLTSAAMIALMYPKYCFSDGTYRIIIEEHGLERELEMTNPLTREELELYSLLRANPDQIRVKSKLLAYIEEHAKMKQ